MKNFGSGASPCDAEVTFFCRPAADLFGRFGAAFLADTEPRFALTLAGLAACFTLFFARPGCFFAPVFERPDFVAIGITPVGKDGFYPV
jgi:hypothetical protein